MNLNFKLRSAIRKFYLLKTFCGENLLKTIYFGLIHSRIQYGLSCWGGSFSYLINRIRTTQNYFLRIILGKRKRESSFPLYVLEKILPVEHLFVFKVLKIFYFRSGNRGTVNAAFNVRSNNQILFRLPKVKKSIFRMSFEY